MNNLTTKVLESSAGIIAAVSSDSILINDAQDAIDLIATVRYKHDCDAVIIPKNCIAEPFFDLKTKIAGEALQKFTNYQLKVAIVGDFRGYTSKALKDFLYECNKGNAIFFLATQQEAVAALERQLTLQKE